MNGLHKWRWRFLFVWLVAFTALTAYEIHANGQLAQRTNHSLCTLRGDLTQRIRGSEAFLLAHPHGIPGLVSASEIRQGILNEQHTVAALSNLNCKEGN